MTLRLDLIHLSLAAGLRSQALDKEELQEQEEAERTTKLSFGTLLHHLIRAKEGVGHILEAFNKHVFNLLVFMRCISYSLCMRRAIYDDTFELLHIIVHEFYHRKHVGTAYICCAHQFNDPLTDTSTPKRPSTILFYNQSFITPLFHGILKGKQR